MHEHPEKKLLTLPPARVCEETKRAIELFAIVNDRTVSWVIREAVEQFLDREQEKHESMKSIFSGRERRVNRIPVEQSDTADWGVGE